MPTVKLTNVSKVMKILDGLRQFIIAINDLFFVVFKRIFVMVSRKKP
jgi:hypothetical protein